MNNSSNSEILQLWTENRQRNDPLYLFIIVSVALHIVLGSLFFIKIPYHFPKHRKAYVVKLVGNPYGDNKPGKSGALIPEPPKKKQQPENKVDDKPKPQPTKEVEKKKPKPTPVKQSNAKVKKKPKPKKKEEENPLADSWLNPDIDDDVDDSAEEAAVPSNGERGGSDDLKPGDMFSLGEGDGTGLRTSGSFRLDAASFPYIYYLQAVRNKIAGNWDPKIGHLKRGSQLSVVVYFKIQKNGELSEVYVEKSSGNRLLDQTAQRAIRLSEPFPWLPPAFKDEELGVHFTFHLTQ